jgi:cell division protein FtsQ
MRVLKRLVPKWPMSLRWGGAGRHGQPRRRVVPWWRTTQGRALTVGLPVLLTVATVAWGWQARWPARAADWAGDRFDDAMVGLGFAVGEVWVVGRNETPRGDLIAAIAVATGDPILDVDLAALRDRVRDLPWVREASVRRVLPGTLIVEVRERAPLARWQHQGEFALIDETGEVLSRDGLARFTDLPVVVGVDAPPHAAALLTLLRADSALFERVRAAVRFGGRRWNVHLEGDVVVRLPEIDAAAAWLRLASYQRQHRVLDQNVQVLDLRFPDQVIVRLRETPGHAPVVAGRDT